MGEQARVDARLLRNWVIVYAGNFAGAIATAALLYGAKQYEFGKGAVGDQALSIAATKTGYGWWQAVLLGAFCNALVCLAVWLCYSARTTADKVLAIIPPIAAFVAAGFEHSVANMFFIPYGLFVKSNEASSLAIRAPQPLEPHMKKFLWANLVPVTIGNIVGGAVMVGAVYWFAGYGDVYADPVFPRHQCDQTSGSRFRNSSYATQDRAARTTQHRSKIFALRERGTLGPEYLVNDEVASSPLIWPS